ncbi:MAG: acetate/propionate family kinase [Betaproteobacteria bacterium]
MTRRLLTLNAGSSSIKFALFSVEGGLQQAEHQGQVDGIGTRSGPADHTQALQEVMAQIGDADIAAVGHRIVHGGTRFEAPCLIDEQVATDIESLTPLAPLHQPHNLAGVRAAQAAFPGVPQVACFDTAFHRHMPEVQQRFALPDELFQRGIRRYGFHGLSYESITTQLREQHPALAADRVVVAHLGNGCSMTAVQDGRSVATTMSFSPLDGLTMGTRCGRLDAAVVLHLQQQEGFSTEEVSRLLHKGSGLLGLSGLSSDMRELEAAARTGHAGAQRALNHFVEQVLKELAALAATLRGLDALVFTGGIGENGAALRERIVEGAAWLGLRLDPEANARGPGTITLQGSPVQALVMKTNEEAVIAGHTARLAGLSRQATPAI